MIQKLFLKCSTSRKKIHYCVKVVFIFFNKNKTPKHLVPTNIRLTNDIDSVKKLNESKE